MAITDFSCVYYEDGDPLGKLLAYSALLPYVLIVHHASRFYSRREVHEGVILSGLVLNEAVARGLKHALRHQRPAATCARLNLCNSYGMPSSHTQCIAFGLVLHTFLCLRLFRGKSAGTRLTEACEVLLLAVGTVLTAASRVYLGYHTLEQVAAGGLLGAVLGALCFWALGWRCWEGLAGCWLGRLLHLRGSWGLADPLAEEAEWYRARVVGVRGGKEKAQ
ncbi:hypothetical protein Agub_g4424 [Astrephomene gubernaculifera]|uniref:Phosphatidic acid phosphatase type 2/haloperoxidase domain-containing protein n=1 Tax=Astrephomene gubernaculifera TaxID=47775 RepID=A0AAD3HJV1_9CHLO|nr:hypothetical protein Agub_g4424 [Astrephomene gubernaculifera]